MLRLQKYNLMMEGIRIVPAPNGTIVGSTIEVGTSTAPKTGNILALASIPDGTVVCNIEKNTGDGGKLIKAAG